MAIYLRTVVQLLREFWPALIFAAAVTYYSPEPDRGWNTWALIATFWAALISFGWLMVQWVRVQGKLRTVDKLVDITSQLQAVATDLRVATTDLEGHITGGTSVPYVYGLPDHPQDEFSPRLAVKGKYSQRDVHVTIREVPFDDPTKAVVSKRLKVGDVIAGHIKPLPPDILDGQKGDDRRLFITLQGLNGTTQQFLHLRKVNGQWHFATRLMAHGREILEYRDPGYPQQPDWIDDMRLSGVVLGGKGYDPLPG